MRGALRSVIAPSYRESDIPSELIHTVDISRADGILKRIPYRVKVPLGLGYFVQDNAYDRGARQFITPGGVFHGWSHQALFSLRRARELGCRIVVERPNSHPQEMRDLVRAERLKYGVKARVDGPFELTKCVKELQEADRVIVCSEFARQSHLKYGIPDSKIRVINYGVDTHAFTPGIKQDDTFRIIFCGMVCLRKGPQYLLQAWRELSLPNAELWLIGMVLPDAVGLMEEHKDTPGVRIVGHVDSREELAKLYQQGSVFVFPSVEDGFGMVVTEAMACGVPVIISDNTGARDVVRHGENGFVVPTYEVEPLKNQILQIYRHPELARDLGVEARKTAEANTWDHYSEKLMAVYRELA